MTVRMVTGDNLTTATAIAKACGILTPSGIADNSAMFRCNFTSGIALEGPVFRTMTPSQVDAILPRLQVEISFNYTNLIFIRCWLAHLLMTSTCL